MWLTVTASLDVLLFGTTILKDNNFSSWPLVPLVEFIQQIVVACEESLSIYN